MRCDCWPCNDTVQNVPFSVPLRPASHYLGHMRSSCSPVMLIISYFYMSCFPEWGLYVYTACFVCNKSLNTTKRLPLYCTWHSSRGTLGRGILWLPFLLPFLFCTLSYSLSLLTLSLGFFIRHYPVSMAPLSQYVKQLPSLTLISPWVSDSYLITCGEFFRPFLNCCNIARKLKNLEVLCMIIYTFPCNSAWHMWCLWKLW